MSDQLADDSSSDDSARPRQHSVAAEKWAPSAPAISHETDTAEIPLLASLAETTVDSQPQRPPQDQRQRRKKKKKKTQQTTSEQGTQTEK